MTLDFTQMTDAQKKVFELGNPMWAFVDRGWTMDDTISLLWHEGGNDGFVNYTIEENGTVVKSRYNFTKEMWLPESIDVPKEGSD